ncbi:MAG: MEDS domain-containing protein [Candidatus Omnitrophica bacterium]|nr:MEDS domain-containing protein [Candidatus Omnitrophota bacterium]
MINYTPPTQHTSLFYNSQEEYLDIIMPYFKAGLDNNEFCLWNLPETLNADDARKHLLKAVEDLDIYLKKDQLSIRDYKSFYLKDGVFSAQKVIESFAELEKKVLGNGFKGVRVAGDGTWAIGENWFDLMMYENEINRIIESHKIRAICSYCIKELDSRGIRDIGMSHQSSLVKQMDSWNRLDSSKFSRTIVY